MPSRPHLEEHAAATTLRLTPADCSSPAKLKSVGGSFFLIRVETRGISATIRIA
jgi:hypothetical protein